MKKLVVLVLVAALVGGVAFASAVSFDFSGLSLAELIDVQKQLTAAMWAPDEWQEVEVPTGVYEVGKDIPAGHWTISYSTGVLANVVWGTRLNESKTGIKDYDDELDDVTLDGDRVASVSWDLTEGTFVVIEYAPVVFTPYTGPNLGFK